MTIQSNVINEHNELLAQESNIQRLQEAYALLSTSPSRGVAELEEMAKGGSVLSMLYLANHYHRGAHADLEQAERWYRQAYERNAMNSFSGLGAICFSQARYREAEEIFMNGTLRGDGVSMYWLAEMYRRKFVCRRDKFDVKELLERSMSLGQIRAKNRLAVLLLRGTYGLKNVPRGVGLYFSSIIDGFRVGLRNPDDRRLW
jgi:TPR repeat protein